MKELKYIKLFEAFESIKISKTLAYINKSSRDKFIEKLRTVLMAIDFPPSKISDDFLQYLPFNKALELNANSEDKPCEATSVSEFEQSGIEGEKCEGGLLKRKWGRGIRTVECPNCKGTGIQPKMSFPIKWIKFWFDKDGNYVETGVTDGKIRTQLQSKSASKVSQNISDYKVVKELSKRDLLDLPTGSIVKITLDSSSSGTTVIGTTFRSRSLSRIYIIQDKCDGSAPDHTRDWKTYGKLSWVITSDGSEYTGTPVLLEPRVSDETEKDEKPDPYTWNAILGRGNTILNESDMKSKLKEAHFAIVLDFLELSNSEFRKTGEIKKEREQSRQGATALVSDEEVRKMNIERYIDEISKKLTVSKDLKNLPSSILRFLGGNKIGYYILRGRHFSDFDTFLTLLYKLLSLEDESEIEFLTQRLVDMIKSKIDSSSRFNDTIMENISDCKKTEFQNTLVILKRLDELNNSIYEKIKNTKFEDFEDVELFHQKIKSIRNIWKESDRFAHLRAVYQIVDNLENDYRLRYYLVNSITSDNIDDVLADIDRFEKVIARI